MKLLKLSTAMLLMMSLSAYAGYRQNHDVCSNIAGHWHGIYTLKNPDDCRIYKGCTHLVMTDVTVYSAADKKYHVVLNPAVGEGGDFLIKCENNVITSPQNPGNQVFVNCNDSNHCYVLYEDGRLTSEMMKG